MEQSSTTEKGEETSKISKEASSSSSSELLDPSIQLLRQQKQSLRKQIRSVIKSTYPKSDSSSTAKLIDQSDLVFSRLYTLPQYTAAKTIGFFLSMPHGEIQTRKAIRRMVEEDGKTLFVPRVGLDFELCDMNLIRCDTTAATAGESRTAGESSGAKEENNEEKDDGRPLFYDAWPRNKWGIPEPPLPPATNTKEEDGSSRNDNDNDVVAKEGDIDLLLVPGLAFDRNGHRLGQGKGYYDRFIAKMMHSGSSDSHSENDHDDDDGNNEKKKRQKKNPMLLVGVCLEEQFLEEVPHGVDLGNNDNDTTKSSEEGGGGGKNKGGIIPISDHDYIMDMVLTPSKTLIVPK